MNRNEPVVRLDAGDVMLDDLYSADGLARSGHVDRLLQYRSGFHREASRIVDQARKEGRNVTEAEERRFDELFDLVNAIDSRMEKAREKRERIGRDSARFQSSSIDPGSTSREYVAWTRGENATVDLPLNPLVEWTVARSRNRRAELRDYLTTNVDSVPRIIYDELLMRLVESSAVLSAGPRTITTRDTGADLRVPYVSQYGTASIVAEGSAIPESDATFASVTLGGHKYGNLAEVSTELLFESGFDLAPYLAQVLGTQVGRAIASHLTTGSGIAQPEGIVTNATVGVTGTAIAPNVGNIYSLWASLPTQYRANASWIMSPATWNGLVTQLDADGRSLVIGDVSSAQPMMMFGAPVYLDSTMPANGTANKSVWVGDMSRYATLRFAGELRIELSDAYKFDRDLIVWRALMRLDMKVTEPDAARVFVGA